MALLRRLNEESISIGKYAKFFVPSHSLNDDEVRARMPCITLPPPPFPACMTSSSSHLNSSA